MVSILPIPPIFPVLPILSVLFFSFNWLIRPVSWDISLVVGELSVFVISLPKLLLDRLFYDALQLPNNSLAGRVVLILIGLLVYLFSSDVSLLDVGHDWLINLDEFAGPAIIGILILQTRQIDSSFFYLTIGNLVNEGGIHIIRLLIINNGHYVGICLRGIVALIERSLHVIFFILLVDYQLTVEHFLVHPRLLQTFLALVLFRPLPNQHLSCLILLFMSSVQQ